MGTFSVSPALRVAQRSQVTDRGWTAGVQFLVKALSDLFVARFRQTAVYHRVLFSVTELEGKLALSSPEVYNACGYTFTPPYTFA